MSSDNVNLLLTHLKQVNIQLRASLDKEDVDSLLSLLRIKDKVISNLSTCVKSLKSIDYDFIRDLADFVLDQEKENMQVMEEKYEEIKGLKEKIGRDSFLKNRYRSVNIAIGSMVDCKE